MESSEPVSRKRRTALFVALKLALATALMWWLVSSGRLEWHVLARLRFRQEFMALLGCRLMILALQMVRWQRLVEALGLKLRPAQAVHIGLIGSFFGLVAPASLGQDGARIYYGTRENGDHKPELISSIVVDRFLGLVALLAMAILGGVLLMVLKPHPAARNLPAVATLLLASVVVAVLVARRSPRILQALRAWSPVQRVLAGIWHYRLHKRAVVEALLLSLLSQAILIVSMWLAFVTLDFNPPGLIVCAVTPLVSLSYGIPLTPMGLGVSDVVGDALYQMMGINGGAEANLVMRVAMLLVSAASAVAFLIPFRRGQAGERPISVRLPDAIE